MKKKIVAIVVSLALVVLAISRVFVGNKQNTLNAFKDSLNNYYLEGKMSLFNGEDKRDFLVEVSYEKNNEDFYKVSLTDLGINQRQVILKNSKGVYVINPTLNSVYEFDEGWPLNSLKPYTYDSLLRINDNKDIKKVKDGYLINTSPNYEDNENYCKQEVKLDKEFKLDYVNIYDKENDIVLAFDINLVEFNKEFANDYFEVDYALNEKKDLDSVGGKVSEEELPFMPTNSLIEAVLKESSSFVYNDDIYHILSYEGEHNFTLVERILKTSDDLYFEKKNGKLVDILNGVGYYELGVLSYVYNNVEYSIYSDTMSLNEMIELANGVEVSYSK